MTLCLNRTKEIKLQGKVFYFIHYLKGQDKGWNALWLLMVFIILF